ncbi:hypothetical protein [Reichenbachiella sp.]|uniref:hypothetical protein n=1 Tax=Reichenbachiella sp. TaxID=2184521 RepID=UPI003BAE6CDF
MKRIYNIVILGLIIVGMAACKEEYEAPGTEPNNSVVFSSEMSIGNIVQVNGLIGFGDASAGVVDRIWTVPENVATIEDEDGNVSDEANINVAFSTAGTYQVTLHQIFAGNAFVGNKEIGTEYDTTMSVTVLDSIDVAFTATHINDDGTLGSALTIGNGAENEVIASKSVRFNYSAVGAPNEVIWTFEGGDPAEVEYDGNQIVAGDSDDTDVRFKRIGTYGVTLIGRRDRPFGGDTVVIENLIKVIPSTEPVDLDAVYDKEDEIVLNFSREIDPTSFGPSNFSVTIENETTWEATVLKTAVDPNEGNLVILTLDGETLYDDDTIKISYTPGIMQTTDLVAVEAFTDVELVFLQGENLMTENGYDVGMETSTPTNWPDLGWGGNWALFDLSFSSTQVYSGSKSMYMEWEAAGGCIVDHRDDLGAQYTFGLESGKTYELGFWIYIEDLGNADTGDGFMPDLRFYPDDWSTELAFFFNDEFPTGEWVYQSTTWSPGASRDFYLMMRGYNASSTVPMNFYLDDLTVFELNLRP